MNTQIGKVKSIAMHTICIRSGFFYFSLFGPLGILDV